MARRSDLQGPCIHCHTYTATEAASTPSPTATIRGCLLGGQAPDISLASPLSAPITHSHQTASQSRDDDAAVDAVEAHDPLDGSIKGMQQGGRAPTARGQEASWNPTTILPSVAHQTGSCLDSNSCVGSTASTVISTPSTARACKPARNGSCRSNIVRHPAPQSSSQWLSWPSHWHHGNLQAF